MKLKEYLEWEGMIRLRAYAEALLGSESEEAQGIVDEVIARESLKHGGLSEVEATLLFRLVKYRVVDFWRSKAMKTKMLSEPLQYNENNLHQTTTSHSLDENAILLKIKERIGVCPIKNALFDGYSHGFSTREIAKSCTEAGICSKSRFYRIRAEFTGLVMQIYAGLGYPELINQYQEKGAKSNG